MAVIYTVKCERFHKVASIADAKRGDMITPYNFNCDDGIGDCSGENEGKVLCTILKGNCPVYESVFQRMRGGPPTWVDETTRKSREDIVVKTPA